MTIEMLAKLTEIRESLEEDLAFLTEQKKKAKKSMKLGGGGRFAKLKGEIAKKGSARNPAAVAAAAGRKKYGKKAFQKMAAKGRARNR